MKEPENANHGIPKKIIDEATPGSYSSAKLDSSAFEERMRELDFHANHYRLMGKCVRCGTLGCPSCKER